MKKLLAIIGILALVFVFLASLQMLPEPIQAYVNQAAHKMFPAKDNLEQQRDRYYEAAEEAVK